MKLELRSFRMLALLPAILMAAACGESNPLQPYHILFSDVAKSETTLADDPAKITAAWIEGDVLHMRVSFGGGCTDHLFALVRPHAMWRESYRVQTDLRLTHEANDDRCLALLNRSLAFDLEPLKQAFYSSYGSAQSGVMDIFLYEPAGSIQPRRLRYHF